MSAVAGRSTLSLGRRTKRPTVPLKFSKKGQRKGPYQASSQPASQPQSARGARASGMGRWLCLFLLVFILGGRDKSRDHCSISLGTILASKNATPSIMRAPSTQ